MASSPKKDIASINIVGIIKACARHRVATLKFGDLELSFNPKVKTTRPGTIVPGPSQFDPHTKLPVTEITENQKNIARTALEFDELTLRDQQFAELLVTDPQAAEQMLSDGELDDADDEYGGNE